jgi:hypothetical protein
MAMIDDDDDDDANPCTKMRELQHGMMMTL